MRLEYKNPGRHARREETEGRTHEGDERGGRYKHGTYTGIRAGVGLRFACAGNY